jgi:hypothetical protein
VLKLLPLVWLLLEPVLRCFERQKALCPEQVVQLVLEQQVELPEALMASLEQRQQG